MSRFGWVGWMSLCFSAMHWNHWLVFFKLAALDELFKIWSRKEITQWIKMFLESVFSTWDLKLCHFLIYLYHSRDGERRKGRLIGARVLFQEVSVIKVRISWGDLRMKLERSPDGFLVTVGRGRRWSWWRWRRTLSATVVSKVEVW